MSQPRCSLIVPVFNGLEFLEPMLESLLAHTDLSNCELILPDDGSGPETLAFLATWKDRATVLLAPENRGFASACNAGAARATGEFLVFLNSDLAFQANWLETMLQPALADASVGAVGAKLLYPDGTIQHGGVFLREDRLDRVPLVASHDHVGKPGDDPDANQKSELLAVTAAAILVRRSAFEAIGGFDETFINGYEDVDLCLALGQRGWRVVYEPGCELIHYESKSGAKRFARSRANQRRFIEKWHGRVRPEVLVTPYFDVQPHLQWNPSNAFTPWAPDALQAGSVCIVVTPGPLGQTALTLESIFCAQVGLYDQVVALADALDPDAQQYFQACEGHSDAFSWMPQGQFASRMDSIEQELVAFIKPGMIVTQGWISRMAPWLSKPEVGAVGPMMDHASGPQNALACIEGQGGAYYPNELSQAFCKAFREQGGLASTLDPRCFLVRNQVGLPAGDVDLLANLRDRGLALVIAKDVFVHWEDRSGTPTTQLAAA